jgi:glycosyltransferase involved in cell wall biosynthesis
LKLLILTQYFPPEVGAPQNRLYELAIRLQKEGVDITVLTAMPNYPSMEIHKSYLGKKYFYEEMEGLKVHRSSIFVSKNKSIIKRLQNYFSFVWSSYIIGRKKLDSNYDFILCESPPLFLGISAYLLSKNKKAKMIFNVSDLWPESAEKLGLVTNKLFLKLATILEEFLYRKSVLITGQTQGIVENISTRFPQKNVYWLPNGVDLQLYNPENIISNWREENGFFINELLLLYAGIIGYAQGLEIILKAAKKTEGNPEIKYLLLGSGPEKDKLLLL